MANPIAARLNGDDYQARHFWTHALDLVDGSSGVAAVSYDFSDKKSFDDVVVEYNPPRGQAHASPLHKHYLQIKWQTVRNARFGYADLVDPQFINASSVSLLHRLKAAKRPPEAGVRFSFATTARIKDGDPLSELVSSEDGVLKVDRLKTGKGPRSKMGAVRAYFKEKLDLGSDAELYNLLEGFAILDSQPNMEEMRDRVATKARSIGLYTDPSLASASDFRFDALGRELIKRRIENLDREGMLSFLKQQGLTVAPTFVAKGNTKSVLIRVFQRPTTDPSEFEPDSILSLGDRFEDRYLLDDHNWITDVSEPVTAFLLQKAREAQNLQLTIDANASIAFATGRILHLKSGVRTELVQNGQRGREIWHSSDGVEFGNRLFDVQVRHLGPGDELAVAVSISRTTDQAALEYTEKNLQSVGKLIHFHFPSGPQQSNIAGGQHAATLADQLAACVREIRQSDRVSTIHLFISAPNAFVFFLGQHAQALGSHQMYEYDFDGYQGGSYIPSL